MRVTQLVYRCFRLGVFARWLNRFGHVSLCFGETGDRNTCCSPLCDKGTFSAEDNTRPCVAPELFGCEGRSASV